MLSLLSFPLCLSLTLSSLQPSHSPCPYPHTIRCSTSSLPFTLPSSQFSVLGTPAQQRLLPQSQALGVKRFLLNQQNGQIRFQGHYQVYLAKRTPLLRGLRCVGARAEYG